MTDAAHTTTEKNDFIRQIIRDDLAHDKHDTIVTRFPPEPNGYLHIGHVKSICLNFGVAKEFGGACNLRFDDTNPTAEKQDYVDSIKEDVAWLGFDWAGEVRYASHYFDQLHAWAIQLIKQGDAYVDFQTPDEIREHRGGFGKPSVPSPQRNASIEENLAHFEDMKNGKYKESEAVLRAKIDMNHANMNMRDPVIYRIMHASHHQTGDKWCIYPMYDYAHPLSDAIEGITHSLCTLEFEDHRPFYDWVIDKIGFEEPPHQYEFSRLNIDHTLTSKRKLKRLVDLGVVSGWDDPRMPTVAGMRRRGYPAEGLRDFCERIGVSKADGTVDFRQLEFSIRHVLENTAGRGMAVLRPLKVTIVNFDEAVRDFETLKKESVKARLDDGVLWLSQPKYPQATHNNDKNGSERDIPFTKTIYIDQSDFELSPPEGYKRLSPANPEIRLRNSYVLKVEEYVTDDKGEVVELIATIDPKTLGNNPEGRKVKGVIHWVSASHGVPASVRLYEHLLVEDDDISEEYAAKIQAEHPDADEDTLWILTHLNPNSVQVLNAVVEPSLAQANRDDKFQFERESYFVADMVEHHSDRPVFNQIVSLKDGFK